MNGRAQHSLHGWLIACLSGALCQLGIISDASADAASPGRGNPLDSLPRIEKERSQPVVTDIQTPAPDPALQRLLTARITPSRFQIAGVKSLPFEEVAAAFSGLRNREITVAELLQTATEVTKLYRDRGYPLSFAFVPAQTFKDNIVVVNIVEGYVEHIKVEGNPGASETRLREIGAQLSSDRPLSQKEFERVAAVLGQQPGMQIKATVRPPTTTDGASEMVLEVKRKPINASIAIDRASENLRGILTVTTNGLTPLGEQLTFNALAPKGPMKEEYAAVTYTQPIRHHGMLLQISLSRYQAEPQNRNLVPQQFEPRYRTETERASITVSKPLVLTATRNLTLSGGIYAVHNAASYTRSVPATPPTVELSSDIRALSLELRSSSSTSDTATQWSLAAYQGIDGMGARQMNNNVDLDFLRIRGNFSHRQRFANSYGYAVSGMGQVSSNTLPLSEQISYGARLFGAAYPAGEIAGDSGWGMALEFNRTFSMNGKYIKEMQPYLLGDAAQTHLNNIDIPNGKIASMGTGIRWSDKRHYSLDLSIAQPVGNLPVNASKRSPRVNLSYAYQFE